MIGCRLAASADVWHFYTLMPLGQLLAGVPALGRACALLAALAAALVLIAGEISPPSPHHLPTISPPSPHHLPATSSTDLTTTSSLRSQVTLGEHYSSCDPGVRGYLEAISLGPPGNPDPSTKPNPDLEPDPNPNPQP